MEVRAKQNSDVLPPHETVSDRVLPIVSAAQVLVKVSMCHVAPTWMSCTLLDPSSLEPGGLELASYRAYVVRAVRIALMPQSDAWPCSRIQPIPQP